MFVGPVFSVELITSARRARYFIWRVAYALLLLGMMVCVYLGAFGFAGANTIDAAANFASYFFISYAHLQLGAVMLLGPAITAGAIAQERERRTIEYLFTTHLSNTEIVLSKLSAAVVQLTSSVLVGIPVLAIAMWLGGLEPEKLLAVIIVTISTIITMVALSMTASVLSRKAREAVAGTYIVLVILAFGPMLLDKLLGGMGWYAWIEPVVEAVRSANPVVVLARVLDDSGNAAAGSSGMSVAVGMVDPAAARWRYVWGSVLTHLAFSAICVAWSAWALRRLHLEARLAVSTEKEAKRWRLWRPKLGEHPIVWREMHARSSPSRLALLGRILLWIAVLGSIGVICWQYIEMLVSGKPDEFITFVLAFGTLLGCCSLLLMAAWASNSIAAERENETWTMLISTPLLGHEVFQGKLFGSIYAARLALAPLSLLWLLAVLAEPGFILVLPLVIIAMGVLSFSSTVMGLSFSLWCTNSTRALGATLGVGFGVLALTTCCYCPLGFVNPTFMMGLMPGGVYFWGKDPNDNMWIASLIVGVFWLIGVAVHGGAAALLWFTMVQSFDRLAGRAVIPFSGVVPMAPQTPFAPPPAPELVDQPPTPLPRLGSTGP